MHVCFFVCVAFTVASYYLWIYGYINVLVCMVGILFFGIIGIPAMTMAIIKPGYLRVDENGFEFDNVNARKVKISWDQIESIQLVNLWFYKKCACPLPSGKSAECANYFAYVWISGEENS